MDFLHTFIVLLMFGCGCLGRFLESSIAMPENDVFDYKVCQSIGCFDAARSIKENMNQSVDPCEDFFEFACGGWNAKNKVPSTESHWSQFSVVDKKLNNEIRGILESEELESDPYAVVAAKRFYKACLDTDVIEEKGLKPLLLLLNSFGGWPMAQMIWRGKNFNWQSMLTDAKMLPTPIISVSISKDSKNSTCKMIYIDQPSLGVMRSMLLDQITYKDQIGAFKAMVKEIAQYVAYVSNEKIHSDILDVQVNEIVNFETEIAKISSPNEMRRNSFRIYNPMTLRQLQAWTDSSSPNQVNWLELIQGIFKNSDSGAGIIINWTETVVVRELDYLFKLMKLIEKTPNRVLSNYLNWKLVRRYSGDLNDKLRKISYGFDKALSGITQDQPRWKECMQTTSNALPMAVGYSYVLKYFDITAKNVAQEMSENIKTSFKEVLSKASWMDPETRRRATFKVDSMLQMIGYPDWFNNASAIDELYKDVKITDDHFNNVINARIYSSQRALSKLRKTVDRNEWPIAPAVVNAFNFGQSNAIVFPAGILQHPFFTKDRIEALNYGGIGVVIGHEIIHGFDDDGRQFDAAGNLAQWWSDSTLETYLDKAQCFVDQYNGYRIPQLDEILFTKAKVNGVTTQGENIADNGGVHIALQAYRKFVEQNGNEPRLPGLEKYTPEQLFFIGFATNWCESATKESLLNLVLDDPHSPHHIRVAGSLANSLDFTQAFFCPPGSANAAHIPACQLW